MATIHDIAREMNVTASTVSRALNDHPRISHKTKEAVRAVALRLGYQHNQIASALRNGKSRIIGIIVPTIDRSFFASVVRGIEEIVNAAGYHVLVCQSNDDHKKETNEVEALLNARAEGIIISIGKRTEGIQHLKKTMDRGIPLVMFDRTTSELPVSEVVIDDYAGAYQAVEHLALQGCTQIAHFTSTQTINIFKERYRGYRDALKAHYLPFNPDWVIESDLQLKDGVQGMEQLLALKDRPDALFSASDYAAIGAMETLKKQGVRIPDDMAMAGFSNEPFTSFSDPALTSVDQHSLEMGNIAAHIFFRQRELGPGQHVPEKIVLRPTLVVRSSSRRNLP